MIWLATGLSGELGTQIRELLSTAVELLPLDLNKPVKAQRILHLAARRPVHTIRQQIDSNVLYHRRVLRYAERHNIPEFVFFSTASLYNQVRTPTLSEDHVNFAWNDVYSWTKWLGEQMLSHSRIPKKITLRLPAVLEMHSQTNFISRAYAAIAENQALRVTNLDQPFNRLISAEEIVRFLKSHLPESGTYNFAPNPDRTLREVLTALSRSLHKGREFSDTPSATPSSTLDISKLKATGFQPIDSCEMIRRWAQQRSTIQD